MLSFATSLLLVSQVSASIIGNGGNLVRKVDSVEEAMKRYVNSIIEPVQRRQAANITTTSMTGMNLTAWNEQTSAACTASLESLNGVASNPSGLAVCYNLPSLDNTTGVFEADLRLFSIAAPTGDFANIPSQNVQVGLSYNGATVAPVNASSLKRRSEAVSLISWPRGLDKRATAPTLLQQYSFVGQINQNLLTTPMGTAALQKVLVPVVTLVGTSSTGTKVNTSLSSNEATFVSGVFASVVVPTKAQASPPIQTLVVAKGAPFVLPGYRILIFPIGLVITSIWAVALVGTIAYGTVGRLGFRENFRLRTARALKGDQARI